MKTLLVLGLFALVPEVREIIATGDFKKAEAMVAADRKASGLTSENVLALSWLGRAALAAKNYAAADGYAIETERQVMQLLKKRKLDTDADLPLALGASIEVQGQAMAARGERDRALVFLREQLGRYRATSIRARIQKNINLIDLVGKRAPQLDIRSTSAPFSRTHCPPPEASPFFSSSGPIGAVTAKHKAPCSLDS